MDDDVAGCLGGLIGILLVLALIYVVVVYVIIPMVTVLAGATAICGAGYGGFAAIGNYVSSFHENVVKSNKR